MYMAIIYTREPKTDKLTEISHKRFLNKKEAEKWALEQLQSIVRIGINYVITKI